MVGVSGAVMGAVVALGGGEERVERWRGDLAFLAAELPKRHKNLFFAQPREEWEARVADLDEAIERLADHEIVVELMRLVTSVGDGHTAVQFGSGPVAWKRLPIQVHPFADGLHVVLAPRDLAFALGAKVTAVGGKPIDEAWRRIGEVVSHDNETGLLGNGPTYFETFFVLHGLGLGDDRDHATFTVVTDSGEEKQLDLGGASGGGGVAGGALLGPLLAESKQEPLWRQRRGESYWWTWVAESKLLYLQYNRCVEDPKLPFAQLAEELFAAADQHEVRRFVIDLRHNGGGNSTVIVPLYRGLANRRDLRSKGHLFVAIGPETFSSAMLNAVELKQGWGAQLVGEPTGGKPRSYGEILTFELPWSRLRVSYSTKLFELLKDDLPSVLPDLPAPLCWEHWTSGRDPVLEAIAAAGS